MTALDLVIPNARKRELDSVDIALAPEEAWKLVRHGELGRAPLARALFFLRTLPDRLVGRPAETLALRIDDMKSSPEHPGFQVLVDQAPREVVVGAIGQVWQLTIPFVHLENAAAYAAFDTPGYAKVAWALRVLPLGERDSRVTFELRVDATDEESWTKFQRYFLLIGPGSHFIRRSFLSALAREHGTPESKEAERPLPGDELLPDAGGSATQGVTMRAKPEAIWPWLVQMGGGRAGFYSIDALDNGGVPSASEIRPELQTLVVGQVIPATPEGGDGFEVLAIDENRALVLGGLFDPQTKKQLPFRTERPASYWQVTWAFVLEPLDGETTRLHVRARAAFSPDQRAHATWIVPVHLFMEAAQLHSLRERVEGRVQREQLRDDCA